jgi:hypothetical protein
MSHPPGSGSPRAHTLACISSPAALHCATTLILYHFFDEMSPICGRSEYDPAGPLAPQNGAGVVPPHTEINNIAGLSSIDAVTPIDLPAVPARPFDLTSICASAPLYDESSM